MEKIPITISLKERIIKPFGVWFSSLLMNNRPEDAERIFYIMMEVAKTLDAISEIDDSFEITEGSTQILATPI